MRLFLLDLFIQTGRPEHHPDNCTLTGPQIEELRIHRAKLNPWGWRAVSTGEARIWEVMVNANLRPGAAPVRAELLLPREHRQAQGWAEARSIFMAMGARNGGSG